MTTPVARRHPVSELLNWFDLEPPFGLRGLGLAPYVRVEDYVEEGTYVLRAEMPGIDPEKDLEITIDGGLLTIRGERREEHQDKNLHEFHYGSFTRSVPLPAGSAADEVTATYTDGVLELRAPIDREEPQAQRVPVQRRGT